MQAPVSVIMSTFNRAAFIGEALSALVNQTLPPRQILVVNDGSTDETESALAPFRDKITYLRQENKGKSAALNRALSLATEGFVWVFDDDDIPFSDALSRHMAALARHPDAGFTYSPYIEAATAPGGVSSL